MKFSENWLREWVDPPVSTEELAEQLTMAGLEVEAVSSCRPDFDGVVVARVTAITPHPEAPNLKECRVDDGAGKAITVVCGADNVRSGACYALARVGASLPDGRRIQASELRGVVSEGMLCSAAELGLSEEADRLLELGDDADPGQDLAAYLALDDHAIELSLTPNRGDCLTIVGIAREVAVLNGGQLRRRRYRPVSPSVDDAREIKLKAARACPRYAGRVIRDVDISRATPPWIRERLRRSDIRSLNVVVDITNYVMLELGQPMHAFDNDVLQGPIQVRFARPDETLVLLDGEEHRLDDRTLVIADAAGAVAMAGIMGGKNSAVGSNTRHLFLESAWFAPEAILGRARHYGMHTDASHRFERGVDTTLQAEALERATALILSVCGGRPGPVMDVVKQAQIPRVNTLTLRAEEVSRRLGAAVPAAVCWDIVKRLGFGLSGRGASRKVTVPAFRFDIAIEADLIEEIARINGYKTIPSRLPMAAVQMQAGDSGAEAPQQLMAAVLTERGYYEVITFSFVDPVRQQLLMGEGEAAALLNPIASDLSVMRRSLWPGLLQTLAYNLKRQQQRVRIFEQGRVYRVDGESPVIAGLIYGNLYSEQWDIENSYCDFYDIKSDVQAVLSRVAGSCSEPRFEPARHPALHPGQSAQIIMNNQVVGVAGAVHPRHLRKFDILQPVYVFEMELTLIPSKRTVKYQKLSKYPFVRRDLSVIVAEEVPVADILDHVTITAGEYLHNLELFDLYRGEGIDLGKKSLSLGLIFQRYSSTLIDEEVDSLMALILNSLQEKFGVTLREQNGGTNQS
jgi:phenylalanyl-tRNA synthetase beta chain